MWTSLNQDDLLAARDSLKRRQVEMSARHLEELTVLEAKHAEERNALEAKFDQIGELERIVGTFVEEYLEPAPADGSADPSPDRPQVVAAESPAPKPVEVNATNWWRSRFRSA